MEILQASPKHVREVMMIQSKYLFSQLNENQREKGFVTTPFTEGQIISAISQNGLFVALDEERVVGYMFAASWKYFSAWPIFPFMLHLLKGKEFRKTRISELSTFQYGPVCIDEAYRGKQIFELLFEEMRKSMSLSFPVGITFINQINTYSYHAHIKKVGLELIELFSFNGNDYYALGFDTSITVIK